MTKRDVTKVRIEGMDNLIDALKNMKSGVEAIMVAAALEGAKVVREEANINAPGPHVEIEVQKVNSEGVTIGIAPDRNHWYYWFAEFGTSIHVVKPKKKKGLSALKFEDNGRTIFARRTIVRGVAAAPFIRPAMDRQREILAAISAKLRTVIK